MLSSHPDFEHRESMVTDCSSLLSAVAINTIVKSNLGRRGFIFGLCFQVTTRHRGMSRQKLTQRPVRQGAYWFTLWLKVSFLSYSAHTHQPRDAAAPSTSTVSQDTPLQTVLKASLI